MSKRMTHTVYSAAIVFNPLRVKQSNNIVHRYGGLVEADDQKRHQPKTSCDERIALRASLALCIRGITHASWPDRVFPLCLLPLAVPRDTLSFLLHAYVPLFPSSFNQPTSNVPHPPLSDEVLSRRRKSVPRAPLLPRQLPLTRPRSTQAPRFAANQY